MDKKRAVGIFVMIVAIMAVMALFSNLQTTGKSITGKTIFTGKVVGDHYMMLSDSLGIEINPQDPWAKVYDEAEKINPGITGELQPTLESYGAYLWDPVHVAYDKRTNEILEVVNDVSSGFMGPGDSVQTGLRTEDPVGADSMVEGEYYECPPCQGNEESSGEGPNLDDDIPDACPPCPESKTYNIGMIIEGTSFIIEDIGPDFAIVSGQIVFANKETVIKDNEGKEYNVFVSNINFISTNPMMSTVSFNVVNPTDDYMKKTCSGIRTKVQCEGVGCSWDSTKAIGDACYWPTSDDSVSSTTASYSMGSSITGGNGMTATVDDINGDMNFVMVGGRMAYSGVEITLYDFDLILTVDSIDFDEMTGTYTTTITSRHRSPEQKDEEEITNLNCFNPEETLKTPFSDSADDEYSASGSTEAPDSVGTICTTGTHKDPKTGKTVCDNEQEITRQQAMETYYGNLAGNTEGVSYETLIPETTDGNPERPKSEDNDQTNTEFVEAQLIAGDPSIKEGLDAVVASTVAACWAKKPQYTEPVCDLYCGNPEVCGECVSSMSTEDIAESTTVTPKVTEFQTAGTNTVHQGSTPNQNQVANGLGAVSMAWTIHTECGDVTVTLKSCELSEEGDSEGDGVADSGEGDSGTEGDSTSSGGSIDMTEGFSPATALDYVKDLFGNGEVVSDMEELAEIQFQRDEEGLGYLGINGIHYLIPGENWDGIVPEHMFSDYQGEFESFYITEEELGAIAEYRIEERSKGTLNFDLNYLFEDYVDAEITWESEGVLFNGINPLKNEEQAYDNEYPIFVTNQFPEDQKECLSSSGGVTQCGANSCPTGQRCGSIGFSPKVWNDYLQDLDKDGIAEPYTKEQIKNLFSKIKNPRKITDASALKLLYLFTQNNDREESISECFCEEDPEFETKDITTETDGSGTTTTGEEGGTEDSSGEDTITGDETTNTRCEDCEDITDCGGKDCSAHGDGFSCIDASIYMNSQSLIEMKDKPHEIGKAAANLISQVGDTSKKHFTELGRDDAVNIIKDAIKQAEIEAIVAGLDGEDAPKETEVVFCGCEDQSETRDYSDTETIPAEAVEDKAGGDAEPADEGITVTPGTITTTSGCGDAEFPTCTDNSCPTNSFCKAPTKVPKCGLTEEAKNQINSGKTLTGAMRTQALSDSHYHESKAGDAGWSGDAWLQEAAKLTGCSEKDIVPSSCACLVEGSVTTVAEPEEKPAPEPTKDDGEAGKEQEGCFAIPGSSGMPIYLTNKDIAEIEAKWGQGTVPKVERTAAQGNSRPGNLRQGKNEKGETVYKDKDGNVVPVLITPMKYNGEQQFGNPKIGEGTACSAVPCEGKPGKLCEHPIVMTSEGKLGFSESCSCDDNKIADKPKTSTATATSPVQIWSKSKDAGGKKIDCEYWSSSGCGDCRTLAAKVPDVAILCRKGKGSSPCGVIPCAIMNSNKIPLTGSTAISSAINRELGRA